MHLFLSKKTIKSNLDKVGVKDFEDDFDDYIMDVVKDHTEKGVSVFVSDEDLDSGEDAYTTDREDKKTPATIKFFSKWKKDKISKDNSKQY